MYGQRMKNFINNILGRTACGRANNRKRRAAGALAGLGLTLCMATASAVAAPSDLDTTLGGGGSVITPIGFGGDTLRAIALQPDGKSSPSDMQTSATTMKTSPSCVTTRTARSTTPSAAATVL